MKYGIIDLDLPSQTEPESGEEHLPKPKRSRHSKPSFSKSLGFLNDFYLKPLIHTY